MAIISMKKMSVIAWRNDADALIRRLTGLRCVEIATTPLGGTNSDVDGIAADNTAGAVPGNTAGGAGEGFPPGAELSAGSGVQSESGIPTLVRCEFDGERAALESSLLRVNAALEILHKHSKRKTGLVKLKITYNSAEFSAGGDEVRARGIVERAAEASARLAELHAEENRANALLALLRMWLPYRLPLNLTHTRDTVISLGVLPGGTDLEAVSAALGGLAADIVKVNEDNTGIYIFAVYHNDDDEDAARVLSQFGFLRSSFREFSRTAEEESAAARDLIAEYEAERASIISSVEVMSADLDIVEVLADVERNKLETVLHKMKLAQTGECVLLSGWAPSSESGRIEGILEKTGCAYEFSDPAEGDEPPVLLRNNAFATPFEWVMGMYSYPAYGTFDPSFIMSIFYFILFGVMFADVGYGLVLVLAGFVGVAVLKPARGMKNFLLMFGYCGISCMIAGALFGGYLGDMPAAVMQYMMGIENPPDISLWFNPLEDPMMFLVVSLALGAVHMIAGMCVQFYILCREGKVFAAIFDIGSWFVLFAGLGLLFATPEAGKYVAIAGAAMLVLTQGRAKKGIFGKIIGGVGSLYNLVAYISDLLSYSRILALGLASAVIASVVNILGTMGGGGVFGVIALVAVALFGHTLNIVINVLGTFVHTSRLQYIEFFSKFFVDGGRQFIPALPSEKYASDLGYGLD